MLIFIRICIYELVTEDELFLALSWVPLLMVCRTRFVLRTGLFVRLLMTVMSSNFCCLMDDVQWYQERKVTIKFHFFYLLNHQVCISSLILGLVHLIMYSCTVFANLDEVSSV